MTEILRLEELNSFEIMGTGPEPAFDRVTAMAAELFDAPVSLVTLIDATSQFYKSRYGIPVEFPAPPRNMSFCHYTMQQDSVLVVPDALEDARFKGFEYVTGGPGVRFYAGAPLVAREGLRIGTLCVVDTKPRHDFDARKIRFLETLAMLVMDELHLRRERQRADGASEAKTQFIAHLSHEIRTPLGAIISGLNLYPRLGTLSEKQQNLHGALMGSANFLMSLVNDVLDLAKIESGKTELQQKVFSYAHLMRDIARMYTVSAEEKGLQLLCTVDPALEGVECVGDPVRLRQVFVNLLGNAIKFTDKGTVHIQARLNRRSDGTPTFEYAVTDTGIGLRPESMSRIFNNFEQADDDYRPGGTGLGLPICRKLATLMGGILTVESTYGQGSTFSLSIPHIEHKNALAV
jgi:signal transduction histidine kinase